MLFGRRYPLSNQLAQRAGWVMLSSPFLLAACGGGGGGDGPSTSLPPSANPGTPAKLTDHQIDRFGKGTIHWTGKAPVASGTHQTHSVPMGYVEAADTNARYAWQQGWTGKGQSIAVIDDFAYHVTNGVAIRYDTVPIETRPGTTEYLDLLFEASISHGDLVAAIAGGQHNLVPEGSVLEPVGRNISCADTPCFDGDITIRSVTPFYGVAKDATIVKAAVDLSRRQDPTATLNAILQAVETHHDKAAINLSLSVPVPSSQTSFAAVAAEFAGRGQITSKTKAVIVVALGNQGGTCRQNAMNSSKCNRIGVGFAHMDQLKGTVILAGALNGKDLASYSNQPGDLKAFSLFAQDTASFSGLNTQTKQGTSFAAPRIAGAAAILRHKWPKQSAGQITSLLLATANKDINGDGRADFSGTSDKFGHGKLDLKAALSPVGGLK